jgi:NADH-quinone oxidoreductase subunit L
LPKLLAIAWLLPLASFVLILLFGPRMGKAGKGGGYLATAAIGSSCVLSFVALFGVWLPKHGPMPPEHHAAHAADHATGAHGAKDDAQGVYYNYGATATVTSTDAPESKEGDHAAEAPDSTAPIHVETGDTIHVADKEQAQSGELKEEPLATIQPVVGDWYTLGQFGTLRITIGYYIDALTVLMFTMVTFIATCIHFYAIGYMHDELHEVTDHEVHLHAAAAGHGGGHAAAAGNDHGGSHGDGHGEDHGGGGVHADAHGHLVRPGRFSRFFQYLSLFCFSMLGIVIAGNIAMVFVFWELVGICSYFLIGFYRERKSASTAANKAFIVNRIGDFGMIIGLMALFASLGTFAFGDLDRNGSGAIEPAERGLFSQVRPPTDANDFQLVVPAGMLRTVAADEIAKHGDPSPEQLAEWSEDFSAGSYGRKAYWLLVIAGLGIFCGCVGKSAQFPLHVWLPDAMEGPTPVSALVHSATMVAAGVYLVGRFFPVFAPEVLLVIAVIGCITLFVAATIAITATDIKRVLAYSTVSQLGYMMLALGVGGWVAGLFHLITHAFFKSLLFMCSGSVIHACHTNDMMKMGGLRHKMPWTAYTMLAGCLAIIGAGVPFSIGLSGHYSKDAILGQALLFGANNPSWGWLFLTAAGGAAMTAFYMFRLWYLTFAGKPRDHHIHEHAHESPRIMYMPLVVLALCAVFVGGSLRGLSVQNLLEQARPAGTLVASTGKLIPTLSYPSEHDIHLEEHHGLHMKAEGVAFLTAMFGLGLATIFYGVRWLDAAEVAQQFRPLYLFLLNKWYFDELYHAIFVAPVMFISRRVSQCDKELIDRFLDGLAAWTRRLSVVDDMIDRYLVDGLVNWTARRTFGLGLSLRTAETGQLRQYVVFIVVGTVALAVLVSFWSSSFTG